MLKKLKVQALMASIVAFGAFGLAPALAAELKIGYIDINTALQNTTEYQIGMKRLKALSDQKIKSLKAFKEKINQAEKNIMSQSLAMSPENMSQKQRELKNMVKQFERMQQDAQEEVGAEKNRMDISNMAKLQKTIMAYGKDNHYDMIVPRPVFLYADPKHDLTGDITKLLDK